MSKLLIVATADNHLSKHYAKLTPRKLETRRSWLQRAFKAAVDYAIQHNADIFVQAGDLFDTPDPSNADLDFVASCYKRLLQRGTKILAVGGNHDTPSNQSVQGGKSPLAPLATLGALSLPERGKPYQLNVNFEGRNLSIISFTPDFNSRSTDPLETVLDLGLEPDILVTHAAVEGLTPSMENDPVIKFESINRAQQLRLVVTGHIHQHQRFQLGGVQVLIPGATEQITFGEAGNPTGFAAIKISSDMKIEIQHVDTPHQPRINHNIYITDGDTNLHEKLLSTILESASPDTLMRLVLSGDISRTTYRSLALAQLLKAGQEANFHFEIDTTRLLVVEEFSAGISRGLRVSQVDRIREVAEELIGVTNEPSQVDLIQKARDLILELYNE